MLQDWYIELTETAIRMKKANPAIRETSLCVNGQSIQEGDILRKKRTEHQELIRQRSAFILLHASTAEEEPFLEERVEGQSRVCNSSSSSMRHALLHGPSPIISHRRCLGPIAEPHAQECRDNNDNEDEAPQFVRERSQNLLGLVVQTVGCSGPGNDEERLIVYDWQ